MKDKGIIVQTMNHYEHYEQLCLSLNPPNTQAGKIEEINITFNLHCFMLRKGHFERHLPPWIPH